MPDTTPTLRDRVAAALIDWAYRSNDRTYAALRRDETVRANAYSRADAVLAVLPEPPARLVLGTTDQQPTTDGDEAAIQALSVAGAYCGECGFEPGDRGCPDCERSWGWYVKALRDAGWGPLRHTTAQPPAPPTQVCPEHGAAYHTRDWPAPGAVTAAPADRATVLREAADAIDATFTGPDLDRNTRYGADLLRRMADEAQPATDQPTAHRCGNCEGIDPDTCFNNPHRPPEQCPAAEFEDYGQQCQKPVGHELHTFEAQPATDQPTETRSCGSTQPHQPHQFMRLDVVFQCPGAPADRPDTETEAAPQCSAGLLPATDAAVDRCVRRGKHDSHATAAGVRWGNGSEDEAQR